MSYKQLQASSYTNDTPLSATAKPKQCQSYCNYLLLHMTVFIIIVIRQHCIRLQLVL